MSSNKISALLNNKRKIELNVSELSESLNNNSIKEKCIIYIRCSSKKQNNEDDNLHGGSTQTLLCTDYANNKNFDIVAVVEETGSAINENIKKLRLWSIPETYPNINLIVADPSRLSRNLGTGGQFIQMCLDNNITIHSVRDNVYSNSYDGIRKISDSIHRAYDESEIMKKRLRSTIMLKKKNGSKLGNAPYGYKKVRSANPLNNYPITIHEENHEEQDIIKLVKKYYFGSDMESFYELFQKITNDNKYKLLHNGIEFENIFYGHFYPKDIADKLNENNIFKNNHPWNKNKIKRTAIKIKKNIDENEKLYFTEKYGYLSTKELNDINNCEDNQNNDDDDGEYEPYDPYDPDYENDKDNENDKYNENNNSEDDSKDDSEDDDSENDDSENDDSEDDDSENDDSEDDENESEDNQGHDVFNENMVDEILSSNMNNDIHENIPDEHRLNFRNVLNSLKLSIDSFMNPF